MQTKHHKLYKFCNKVCNIRNIHVNIITHKVAQSENYLRFDCVKHVQKESTVCPMIKAKP